ncbi:MAG TPA: ATP-binding protein [Candidatus Syntrophosphaera thermopropionivorans]|nr:ATP-binding protein [Candidatus Syntrophosphaera thermopropionivorans]
MEFVNREEELRLIKQELSKKESQLIVIYGRRRVGKSALLQKLKPANCIYYLADINTSDIQRNFFAFQVAKLIPGFNNVLYPDWYTFFEQANRQLSKKATIIIDEFPNLVKSAPELPSVLQKIIDLKQNLNFHLIICGSLQQMMYSTFLEKSSPLFGRANRIIKLQPLKCKWLKQILNLTSIQAIEEYSVWGGIPRYWEVRTEYNSLFEAIREAILNPYGILYEEPLRLFMDDLSGAVQPISIASLIGLGCNKLSEIAGRLNKPATSLSRSLQVLIDAGYVKRELCWGENFKNNKKTLYRLDDPLIRFFFTFVVPNQSILNSRLIDVVEKEIKKRWQVYVSETWEELCRQSVINLNVKNIQFLPAQRWWQQSKTDKPIEIDIITESVDGQNLLIGEAKWGKNIKPAMLLRELDQKITYLNLQKKYQNIYRLIMLPELEFEVKENVIYAGADFVCQN